MNFNLASQLIRGNWLISDEFAATAGHIVAGIIDDKIKLEQIKESFEAYSVEASSQSTISYRKYSGGWKDAEKDSIAIIPIKGALMKDDQECGPIGMASIGRRIQEADNNTNIIGILFDIDSPGGTVDGTETLANIVKACKTKTVGFVNGLMASAALWIGSCCDECVASTELDSIGSVGVMISFMDVQPYWEKMGIKFHMVAATQSADKNQRFEKLRKGEYSEYRKDVLDVMADKFISVVKENCPGVTENHLTGKVFFAKDVKGIFISDIMTFENAVKLAGGEELNSSEDDTTEEIIITTDNNDSNNNNSDNTNSIEMKQFKNVNTALGIEALESADGSVNLCEEQLEALENSLTTGAQAQVNLKAEQLAHVDTQKQLTQANEQIANLKGVPGATSEDINKKTDTPKGGESMDYLAKDDVELFNQL